MLSHEKLSRLPHLGEVQDGRVPQTIGRQVINRPRAAIPDQVFIGLGLGVIAGMEGVSHRLRGKNEHVFGKIIIEGCLEFGVRKKALCLEMRDEASGMNAAIGAGA